MKPTNASLTTKKPSLLYPDPVTDALSCSWNWVVYDSSASVHQMMSEISMRQSYTILMLYSYPFITRLNIAKSLP